VRSSLYIFAGGGSGGHLFPGLAVAEQLRQIDTEAKIVFVCSSRPIDRQILDPTPYAVVGQTIRPTPHRWREWPGFLWSVMASSRRMRKLLANLHPRAVLGTGGYAAGPAVWRAARAGYRTALLNPDMVPGKANRALARHVGAIFTQFDSTAKHFPAAARGLIHPVGCPVRGELVSASRSEAVKHFGLLTKRKTLLVFGGSQAAATINAAVAGMIEELGSLAKQWQVLAIVGPEGEGLAETNGSGSHLRIRCLPYCRRMDLAYAAADLAVCRAGAASVAELTATGTPAVFMPYPWHKDHHQHLNAEPLVEAGGAVICEDAKATAANVAGLRRTLLPIIGDSGRLGAMARAMRPLARPEAAREVAQWLCGRPD